MSIKIETLKKVGKECVSKKRESDFQSKVLGVVKKNSREGISLTQKEISDILSKKLGREIRPQHVRSCLFSLKKKSKVVRRELPEPDEKGNYVFWYERR